MTPPRTAVHCLALTTAFALGAVPIGACGPAEGRGPRIEPHLSPVSFGDIRSRPSDVEPDPGSTTYVPYEWTLLVQSAGTETLVIEEVCIVGDDHNGEPGNNAFYFELEEPPPISVPALQSTAIRITYDHRDTNRDLNGDGDPDPDQIALIIQSNAVDFPTLVVPFCARIIGSGREPENIVCESPVAAPEESVADRDLCSWSRFED